MAQAKSSVTVRRASAGDIDAMTEVVEQAWSVANTEALPSSTIVGLSTGNSITTLLASRVGDLWIAEINGRLTAVLGADASGYIWALYVHPDHQRQGIGAALLSEAEQYYRRVGLPSMSLDIIEDNTAASAFYVSQGWVETERREENLPGHKTTIIRYTATL